MRSLLFHLRCVVAGICLRECASVPLRRNLVQAKARVDFGNFALSGLVGREVTGKTVGVWGTGAIGAIFCKIMLVRWCCWPLPAHGYDV